ncbi:unnamed protein product [Choristocarpus tenellus]
MPLSLCEYTAHPSIPPQQHRTLSKQTLVPIDPPPLELHRLANRRTPQPSYSLVCPHPQAWHSRETIFSAC